MKWSKVILPLLMLWWHSGYPQQLNYREISLPEAVSTSTLDLLYTDSDGFLWLAAGPGLYWYDGLHFRKIKTDTTHRPGDGISAIYDDSDGTVWLGLEERIYFPRKWR